MRFVDRMDDLLACHLKRETFVLLSDYGTGRDTWPLSRLYPGFRRYVRGRLEIEVKERRGQFVVGVYGAHMEHALVLWIRPHPRWEICVRFRTEAL